MLSRLCCADAVHCAPMGECSLLPQGVSGAMRRAGLEPFGSSPGAEARRAPATRAGSLPVLRSEHRITAIDSRQKAASLCQ